MLELQIMLPTRIFVHLDNIIHMNVDTPAGNLGFLPRRLDCITPVNPGILAYRQRDSEAELYIAIDKGILVKTGSRINISVHHAVAGTNLLELEQIIHAEFEQLSEQEERVRSVCAGIETKLIRRFIEFNHE